MKIRTIFMVLSLALVASACRKEQGESIERDSVRFSTTLSAPTTKAAVAVTDNFLPHMGVFCSATGLATWDALLHSPSKMFHIKMVNSAYGVVGSTASVWDYAVAEDKTYWESGLGSRFTFFGYAPYASPDNGLVLTSSSSSVGIPTVRYDAPLDVSQRVDFVVAEPRVNIHPISAVGLNMRHALSAVDFQVRFKSAYAGTVQVKRIILHNVQQGGDVSLTADAVQGVVWSVDYTQAKEGDEELTLSNLLSGSSLTTTYASAIKSGQALFVVPQPMTPPVEHTALSPISLTMVFEENGVEFTAPPRVLTQFPDWKSGSAYTYQITYEPGQEVVVEDCQIVPWDTQYDGLVDGILSPFDAFLTYDSPSATTPVDNTATSVTFTVTGTKGLVLSFAQTSGDGAFSTPADHTCDGTAQTIEVTMAANTGAAREAVYSATVTNAGASGLNLTGITIKQAGLPTTIPNPPTADQIVTVGSLKWTKGNLVAKNGNECKVGAATDYGLYFHFGSLVGWSGGANGDGTGTGSPVLAVQVKPMGYTGTTAWTTAGYYTDAGTAGTGYDLPDTDDPITGIGDPCRVYLGAPWQTPTAAEWLILLGASGANTNKQVPLKLTNYDLSFPASGTRNDSDGAFNLVGSLGYYWSSSVYNAPYGYHLYFGSNYVLPQSYYGRSNGMPVRCVSPVL